MDANFSIDPANRQIITEVEIENDWDSVRQRIPEDENIMGGITLLDSTSEMRTEIGDDLESLVPKLCLRSIPILVAGETYTFDLYAYDEQVELKPLGDQIQISGSQIAKATFARSELLTALVGCAERFARFLDRLRTDDGWKPQLDRIKAAVTEAKDQLSRSS